MFDYISDLFQVDAAADVDVVFQHTISGFQNGDWYVVIKNGTCEVCQGRHDSLTTIIKMRNVDFLSIMSGEINPMNTFAGGKLNSEGDIL